MEPIVLIGFMGAGKTTIANILGEQLELPVFDTDKLIVERIKMSISAYFEKFGEEKFREIEADVLQKVVKKNGIISVGGGIVEHKQNRFILKELENVIFLEAPIDTLLERIEQDTTVLRPLASDKPRNEIVKLYQKRFDYYQACSSMTISTKNKTPAEITAIILGAIK